MIPPIPPIPGVTPQLIMAINARLRLIPDSSSASTSSPATSPGTVQSVVGPHAARLLSNPASYADGSFWYESDRGLLYEMLPAAGTWVYLAGTTSGTLANLPTGLNKNDAGLLYNATDYARVFQWSGSAWQRAPGERPTREFAYFADNPGTGWHLCDGTAGVTYTKADGTTATMTMPAETAGTYRKGGSAFTGSSNAGVTPTISGATGAPNATTTVQSGSGATVASSGHTHVPGTLALASAPDVPNVVMLPYMKL